MLLKGVGVGPLGEEGGVGGLSGDKCGIEIGGSNGPKEEGVREGKDTIVIMGTGVVVWAAG